MTTPPPTGDGRFPEVDDRYQIVAELGSGGCGVVYLAQQKSVSRLVAVKLMHTNAALDAETVRRFESEARIVSRLRHPNTVRLFDFGRSREGRYFLVMERLEGEPLDAALQRGPLDGVTTLRVIGQVCESLIEAHDQGVVHRDLKPGNIFLEQVGRQQVVKVLDFGIAKLARQGMDTAAGRIFGTPAYMSPEQARGDVVDARSDLYAVGALAYECLCGVPPFEGESPLGLLLKQLREVPQPLRQRAPERDIDPELEQVVLQLLSKHPDDRLQSAEEVRRRLARIEKRLGAGLTPAVSPVPPEPEGPTEAPPATSAPRRRWGMTALLGVVAAGSIAWSIRYFVATSAPSPPRVSSPASAPPAPVAVAEVAPPPPAVQVPDAAVPDASTVAAPVVPKPAARPVSAIRKRATPPAAAPTVPDDWERP